MSLTTPEALADQEIWLRYGMQPDAPARAAVVARYERLVRILAAKAYTHRISGELEFSDYFQFGMVGLMESIDRFDTGVGVKFETFASRRITGAILDGVESLSEKQRQVSTRQRVLRERIASARAETAATDDVFERLAGVGLGLAIGLLLEDTGMYVAQEMGYGDNSYQSLELRQLQQRIRSAVDTLPDQERKVICLHYLQNTPFDQIAAEQGLSKGRISQIHHKALGRLRETLGNASA